jgi:hypothetical protein
MANVMYGFVAMRTSPGLQALDAIAQHVNTNYSIYGQVEMAQVMYAFARLSFHPGAVVGRVMVVYHRHPDLFDANSHRLLAHALPSLEGTNPSIGALGSRDFDAPTEAQRTAVVERSRIQKENREARRKAVGGRRIGRGDSLWDTIAERAV